MITITAEYLNQNWEILQTSSILPTSFSEWDNGDAYTLSSLGQFPSSKIVFAAIVLGDKKVSDFPLVIRLTKQESAHPECYRAPSGDLYKASAQLIIDESSKNIEIKIVNLIEDLSCRRQGLTETDLLKDASVFIVGLGTGGVQIALDLAKAGVGKFRFMDPDRLEIGNISRHSAGISLVGRRKVTAARDLILEKNPTAEVETFFLSAGPEQRELLKALIEKSSVVICATDNRQSKLLINELCVTLRKTVLFGGAFRRAYGGQVVRVLPGISPCYHCFVLAVPDKEADIEISSRRNADAIAYSDMPVAVEPGLSIDVSPIANLVSKLAVMELIKGKNSTLHILDEDFTAPWYLWVNRPEPNTEYATIQRLSESGDEGKDGMTILRWYAIHMEKESACPTCGDFEGALRKQYGLVEGDKPSILSLQLPKREPDKGKNNGT